MIYHIVTGDMAAVPLLDAMAEDEALSGEVITVKDLLNLGPLQKTEEGQKFSDLRTAFWSQVTTGKLPEPVDDTERILKVSAALAADESKVVWVWVAPWAPDIATLLWVTKYFGKYPGRFFLINIAGLPFLDGNGKLFYPRNISELQPRELIKAKKLARAVSYAEIETDEEEWRKLSSENAEIRSFEGGRRLTSRPVEFYDSQLNSFCSQQFQKAAKIVQQAITKYVIPTGDLYLGWRLKEMANEGKLELRGDITKTLKDFDVRLPSGELFGDGVEEANTTS